MFLKLKLRRISEDPFVQIRVVMVGVYCLDR